MTCRVISRHFFLKQLKKPSVNRHDDITRHVFKRYVLPLFLF